MTTPTASRPAAAPIANNPPDATLRVPVDVTNPGQFFACCGLLELASRLDGETLGWFEEEAFCLATGVHDVMQQFLGCVITVDDGGRNEGSAPASAPLIEEEPAAPADAKVDPLWVGQPFNFRLDWWAEDGMDRAKLKTWSAGQKVTDVLNNHVTTRPVRGKQVHEPQGLRAHLKLIVEARPDDWLRATEPITKPRPFAYDSRLSRNNALDQGHLGDGAVAFSPAVDVLALVGLQRFRPRQVEVWTRNLYCTWSHPLPVDVAAVATLGHIPSFIDRCFEFPVKKRDSAGKYKLFGHAQPVRRPHD